MVDAATQRINMVESQVLPGDVTDHRILRAMRELPREKFVPASLGGLAYIDEPVPVTPAGSARRFILAPRVQAKLLQLADIGDDNHVLDIGCASGYSAALIGRIARSVVAVESDEALAAMARANIADVGPGNVAVVSGRLAGGWPNKAPYDAIVIEGSIELPPEDLLDQLKDGGRLVAIVNDDGIGKATIWKRFGLSMDARVAFDAAAPELSEFSKVPVFVL